MSCPAVLLCDNIFVFQLYTTLLDEMLQSYVAAFESSTAAFKSDVCFQFTQISELTEQASARNSACCCQLTPNCSLC